MSVRDPRRDSLHGWPEPSNYERLEAFRASHTEWRFWQGRAEHGVDVDWYARRTAELTAEQRAAGLVCELQAETANELERMLAEQADLASRDAS